MALLALLVSFILATASAHANAEHLGFRATMIRRTEVTAATINFTRAAQQSHHRLSMLTSRLDTATSSVNTQTPLKMDGDGGGAYDMELSIGTPPQKLTALADTGSDLIWTKCGACASCEPQGSPSYFPDKSSSFSKLPCSARLCSALKEESPTTTCGAGGAECDYKYSYGLEEDSDHYTQGYLGTETFTIGGDVVPGIGFGCTNMSEGGYGAGSGLVGLGRGPLSLVSQLNAGAFSYCLTSDASKASPLLFGSLAALSGGGIQSTPLLGSSVFYAVNLRTISIGFSKTSGVDGGVVFDSGTTLTYLAEPAYRQAMLAVVLQTDLAPASDRDGFEACFYYDEPSDGRIEEAVPSMVLHFDGGANMVLPVRNYFVDVGGGVVCWVVQRSPSVSIIGNVMQVDFHVLHDVDKSVLSFQPANCDSLSGSARLLPKFEGIFLLTALHFLYTVLQLVR
ncbi:aspartic proteinase nepenthesin-1 [Setaria viridis]|uniref:aspartic proteinase nepenthesin-1 n=1 Tax=Setaria viridis TaxID=4556 RepID=UPI0014936B7A|nr:aspartic proteinase nepenthesin-1-like [Setaria viridis]